MSSMSLTAAMVVATLMFATVLADNVIQPTNVPTPTNSQVVDSPVSAAATQAHEHLVAAADNTDVPPISLASVTTALELSRISFAQWSVASAADISSIAVSAFSTATLYEAGVLSRVLSNVSLSCGVLHGCCSGLTGEQLRTTPVEAFKGFTSLCTRQLSPGAIQVLSTTKLNALPQLGVASWSASQIAAISSDVFAVLSARQVVDFTSNPSRRQWFCSSLSPTAAAKIVNASILLYVVHTCGEAFNPESRRVALGRICTLCEFAFVVVECQAAELTADAKAKLDDTCRDVAPKFNTEAEALAIVSAAAQNAKNSAKPPTPVGATPIVGVNPPPQPSRWVPAPIWHSASPLPRGDMTGSHVNAIFGGGGSIAVLLVILTGLLSYAGYVQRMRNRQQFLTPTTSDGPSWTPVTRRSKSKKGTRGGGPENVGLTAHPGGYGSLQEVPEF